MAPNTCGGAHTGELWVWRGDGYVAPIPWSWTGARIRAGTPPLPRATPEFKRLYATRTASERLNALLKDRGPLRAPRHRGQQKVSLLMRMSMFVGVSSRRLPCFEQVSPSGFAREGQPPPDRPLDQPTRSCSRPPLCPHRWDRTTGCAGMLGTRTEACVPHIRFFVSDCVAHYARV